MRGPPAQQTLAPPPRGERVRPSSIAPRRTWNDAPHTRLHPLHAASDSGVRRSSGAAARSRR
eukprot:gene9387-8785_t